MRIFHLYHLAVVVVSVVMVLVPAPQGRLWSVVGTSMPLQQLDKTGERQGEFLYPLERDLLRRNLTSSRRYAR